MMAQDELEDIFTGEIQVGSSGTEGSGKGQPAGDNKGGEGQGEGKNEGDGKESEGEGKGKG